VEATVLTARLNSDNAWTVTARDAGGAAVAFAAADAPEAVAWQGSDSAALFSPEISWDDATAGTLTLTVTHAQTADLSPGVYPLEITAVISGTGQRIPILDCWLELTDTPGTRATPPVYTTLQDLIDFGGGAWLQTLRQTEGLSNFTRERSRARLWLDTLIVKKFRPWSGRTIHWSETSIIGPPDARNPVLRDYLAADYTPGVILPTGYTLAAGETVLMVTEDTKEIVSLKALELICRQRVTLDDKDKFLTRAGYFGRLCRNKVLSYTAELDINGDGLADYAFNLGVINLR